MGISDVLLVLGILFFLAGTHALCYLAGYKHGVEQITDEEDKK